MIFGGLQKSSMIDYPGKISCVLFISGCNFRCPYCHNPQLATGRPDPMQCIGKTDFFAFLKRRTGLLDAVVISGGEPTIQPELPALCREIHGMGYRIKLDTNGSRPAVIRRLIADGAIDYIAMDVKTDPERYAHWLQCRCPPEDITASIDLIRSSGLNHEFRTTCVRPLVDAPTIETIARLIAGARRYALQACTDRRVLDPELMTARCVACTPAELARFKALADPHVQKCLVR